MQNRANNCQGQILKSCDTTINLVNWQVIVPLKTKDRKDVTKAARRNDQRGVKYYVAWDTGVWKDNYQKKKNNLQRKNRRRDNNRICGWKRIQKIVNRGRSLSSLTVAIVLQNRLQFLGNLTYYRYCVSCKKTGNKVIIRGGGGLALLQGINICTIWAFKKY